MAGADSLFGNYRFVSQQGAFPAAEIVNIVRHRRQQVEQDHECAPAQVDQGGFVEFSKTTCAHRHCHTIVTDTDLCKRCADNLWQVITRTRPLISFCQRPVQAAFLGLSDTASDHPFWIRMNDDC